MRWEGRRQSTNFEDRRGRQTGARGGRPGPIRLPRGRGGRQVRRAGGGSVLLFILVALGLWVFAGINPLQLIDMMGQGSGGGTIATQPQRPPMSAEEKAAADRQAAFMRTVLAETEDTWQSIFAASDLAYRAPTLVVYDDAIQSGCGFSSAAVGPYYCPLDQKIYIDLSFFKVLSQRLDAPGDFAQAYVLAHEVGHHVQNLTGVLERSHRMRETMSQRDSNAESVKVELQADCYAGVWARSVDRLLDSGDIDEALGAASAVGDDMLQRQSEGRVVPDSFTHGSAAQRSAWFRRGYGSGNPADCDTFAG